MEYNGLMFGLLAACCTGFGSLLCIGLTCWLYDHAKAHYAPQTATGGKQHGKSNQGQQDTHRATTRG